MYQVLRISTKPSKYMRAQRQHCYGSTRRKPRASARGGCQGRGHREVLESTPREMAVLPTTVAHRGQGSGTRDTCGIRASAPHVEDVPRLPTHRVQAASGHVQVYERGLLDVGVSSGSECSSEHSQSAKSVGREPALEIGRR